MARIVTKNKITLFSCDELFVELKRVLTYEKLEVFKVDIPKAIKFVKSITVQYELQYPLKEYIPKDPDDNYIIALALQTGAGFITSGDKHILSQKEALEQKYKKLHILTFSEFKKRIVLA